MTDPTLSFTAIFLCSVALHFIELLIILHYRDKWKSIKPKTKIDELEERLEVLK